MSLPKMLSTCMVSALLLTNALASGNIQITERTEPFQDQAACREALKRQHWSDVTRRPGRIVLEPGATFDVQLVTKGVIDESATVSRYDSEYWWHRGQWNEVAKKHKVSHTYERRHHVCRDGVMTANGSNGFTQPTFHDEPYKLQQR